ncbi:MAG: hypothetical protein WKF97_11190 [Chitinophagaceae bacterium]
MTINEYQSLPLNGQAVEILRKGVILNSRIQGIKKYILFQLDSFYVEIEYSNLQHKIVNLFSYCSSDPVEVN